MARGLRRVREGPRRDGPVPAAPAARLLPPPASPGFAMTLSRTDVERLAHLARLEIDAGAADAVGAKLDAIFGLIDELNAVDTRGVLPMAHAQDLALPLREDTVTEPDRHALYQQQAPAVEDGLYLVPKVIE